MGSLRQLRATESARRDADHRKDLFLATLAHKLRKPLAPIWTAAQIFASARLATQQLQRDQNVIPRRTNTGSSCQRGPMAIALSGHPYDCGHQSPESAIRGVAGMLAPMRPLAKQQVSAS
jgi:signal transduction histidine kinase